MFRDNNTYLYPQVSSSFHPPRNIIPNSVVDVNGVEILFRHQHPDTLSTGHYLTPNNGPVVDALINPSVGYLNGDPAASMPNASQRKPTVKKDRHSKIFTAQGPRDRRVRLSKGIARKFFDLQEMLGFEKPSKTLDWLLTKSRTAIRELLQTSSAGNEESLSDLAANPSDNYKGSEKQQAAASALAKESRAKARARARERTREKMSIKDNNNMDQFDLNPIQCSRNNQLEIFQLSAAGSSSNTQSCFKENAAAGVGIHDLNQESGGVIRRNSSNPYSFFGFQQNLVVSRDLDSNNTIPSASTSSAAEHWENYIFTSQSNMFAIWDQHKLNNSFSNI